MVVFNILNVIKSRIGQLALVGLVGLGAGIYTHKRFTPPTTTITYVHDVKNVMVEVPTLTEKIIDRLITDPKEQQAINKLVKENNDLKLKLTQVSSTVATNETGGGTITPTNPGTITTGNQSGLREVVPSGSNETTYHYGDFQLNATYTGKSFLYSLTQTFIITSSTGKGPKGEVVGITRLYQDTPNGPKLIPAKTTVISANPDAPHWMLSPRGQIGINVQSDKSLMGIAAFQWLKHGTSKAPEDIKFAIASPALSIQNAKAVPLMLPISYNLGNLKYAPVTNIWLSPTIDLNKKVGVSVTLTF